MSNTKINALIYHHVVPQFNELGTLVGYQDVLIKNAQDYSRFVEEAHKGRIQEEARLAALKSESKKKALEEQKLLDEQTTKEEFQKRQRATKEAYARRYCLSKFLTVYNYLKVLSLEGKTKLTSCELDSILTSVLDSSISIESAIWKHPELSGIYNKLEEF